MADAPWRVQVRQHVASANFRAVEAASALKLLELLFYVPMSSCVQGPGIEEWTVTFRSKLSLARRWTTGAAEELNLAVACMEAAETLALHGANVPSIEHLDLHAYSALNSLQTSRGMAAEASTFIVSYHGHLSTAIALVDAPAIPDSLVLSAHEYCASLTDLMNAMLWTNAALGEVVNAVHSLAPP